MFPIQFARLVAIVLFFVDTTPLGDNETYAVLHFFNANPALFCLRIYNILDSRRS